MRHFFVFVIMCVVCISVYGEVEVQTPAVAKIASYMEGIIDLKVSQEQEVKKGQLLFQVEPDYTETIKAKCEDDVEYYKAMYIRMKKLNQDQAQSLNNFQESEYAIKNAEGSLEIENLLIEKWSKYYAPFDGVVTKIYCFSGSATPGSSGNIQNANAVLELTRLRDYQKMQKERKVAEQPVVAQVAPMIEGIVDAKVTLGEKVKKGQTLFCISTAYNEITKAQDQAKLKYYKANYERIKKLYKENTTDSLQTYQQAEENYKNAVEDLKATELIINKRSTYCSPFDGIVSSIIHYTGSNAFAGNCVMEVTKL